MNEKYTTRPIDVEEIEQTANQPDSNAMKDMIVAAAGVGAITLITAAGTIFVVAGVLHLATWILGGIASLLVTIAPWAAVILGICAFSAYAK